MKKAIIYSVVFVFLLTSCKSKKLVIQKEITKDTIIETVHDTLFSVEKDSSFYNALLECQNGKVVVKEVKETKSGRKLNTPKVAIQNNQLNVDCTTEAETLFASWKDRFIKSYKREQIPVVTNELTWWQQTQININRILLLILVFIVLLRLFKFNQL